MARISKGGYYSPSQFMLYLRSPLSYKRRYIDGIKDKSGPAAVIGKAFHHAFLQYYFKHQDIHAGEVVKSFMRIAEKERKSNDVDADDSFAKRVQEGAYAVRKLYETWTQPDSTEKRIVINIGKVEKPFVMYVDAIDGDISGDVFDSPVTIRDIKTTRLKIKDAYPSNIVMTNLQMRMYAYGVYKKYDVPVSRIMYNVVQLNGRSPEVKHLSTTLEDNWIDKLEADIELIDMAIRNNIFIRDYYDKNYWFNDSRGDQWYGAKFKEYDSLCID